MTIDAITRDWIKNAADEKAAANGCRMDLERAQHVLNFAREHLRLYEGDDAGKPFEPMPWQIDATTRMFGWVKRSERLGRDVRRFRSASVWVPKKNGKSPTLAWWALYLLVGDSEPGQKVYLCAKDGTQARDIAGKHVFEMVDASPALQAECGRNKSTLQVTHFPSKSLLKPISSADSKAQKAKEGLNGCCLIDETHVVDREFVGRISRAGISRSEPLQVEVSTAGDDPESYGKERWDYGEAVNLGTVDNEQHLHISYHAPQDLSDQDLDADPAKWGQLANPSWGHTVHEEEFLADYKHSRTNLRELGRFKMYRLNIWQQASNPWLRMGDWLKCRADFSAESMIGRPCFGGLDLSRTRDMTALALAFPMEKVIRLLVWYWLPAARATELREKASYQAWAQAGHLELCPGEVIDYAFVLRRIVELFARYRPQSFAFDPSNAELMTQVLSEQHGYKRVIFPQGNNHYHEPCEEFERRIVARELEHNGNPVLTWQIGHVQTHRDSRGHIRPTKPGDDHRTIDGVAASVMALSEAMANPIRKPSITWM